MYSIFTALFQVSNLTISYAIPLKSFPNKNNNNKYYTKCNLDFQIYKINFYHHQHEKQ